MRVTEINITPIKPTGGLIGFASVVIDDSLYLGSIAIYRKIDGTFRLLYPTKSVGNRTMDIFHPINRQTSNEIERIIFGECERIFERGNEDVGHNKASFTR